MGTRFVLKNWGKSFCLTLAFAVTFGAMIAIEASAATLTVASPVASNDATNAFYKVSYSGTPPYIQIYLDTDSNATTGYPIGGIGANFLLEIGPGYGQLQKYSGSNGSWAFTFVKSITYSNSSGVANFTVALADLGSPGTIKSLASVTDTMSFAYSSVVTQTLNVTWTFCANENSSCNFTGTKIVRYGANGTYRTLTLTGPVACNNATFGDPLYGVSKHCDYSSEAVSQPAPSPTPTATRDPLKQPFSSTSIWNMPIGSGARYVPANLNPIPGGDVWSPMPNIDEEHIVLRPTAPMTNIYYNGAAWTGQNRCSATGSLIVSVPMPSDYVVPNSGANDSASFLMPDRRTIVQTQPLARCTAGSYATSLLQFTNVDLYGDGITGAHGGSGLSAIGGSIRVGELRPGQQGPKHSLKINVYAKEALYKCATRTDCFRWPATKADSYAVGYYGTSSNNANSAMRMGALLALPKSVTIANLGLESEPGRQIAWTLQNYGAYIVDDTYGPGVDFSVENGPDGSKRVEFQNDYGFPLAQRVNSNTPWSRDLQRIVKALQVVDNNSPTSIGGGGTPLQPLAPPINP